MVVVGDKNLIWGLNKNESEKQRLEGARGNNNLFVDDEFDLSDNKKNYGNVEENLVRVGDQPFIDAGGANPEDIVQGEAGNCWFLSSLCSLSNMGKSAIDRVINKPINMQKNNGAYVFSFFEMGEWVDILIDDRLPTVGYIKNKKGKRLFLFDDAKQGEYWALLLEKAFCKLINGYRNIEGGIPHWALTHLTGGISITILLENQEIVKKIKTENTLFDYLMRIKKSSLIVATNFANADEPGEMNECGLVENHAYSIENFAVVQHSGRTVKLCKLRNPWGEGEWKGAWSDQSIEMANLSESAKASMNWTDEDDGCFWMEFNDVLEEFETTTVCHLDQENDVEHRIKGEFRYNENVPKGPNDLTKLYLNAERHFQVVITVGESEDHLVKLQLLCDLPMKPRDRDNRLNDMRYIFMALHDANGVQLQRGNPISKLDLWEMPLQPYHLPIIPDSNTKGYVFEPYDYNGYIYDLTPGQYVLIFTSSSKDKEEKSGLDPVKFLLRARGQNIKLEVLSEPQ